MKSRFYSALHNNCIGMEDKRTAARMYHEAHGTGTDTLTRKLH